MLNRLRKLVVKTALPLPVTARHVEYSAIASADDDAVAPSDALIDVALKCVSRTRQISMHAVTARMTGPPFYPEVWPGEHYRLLAGVSAQIEPKTVVEIGTATGLSALAILQTLSPGAALHTFDIIPWEQFPDTCLRGEDFADGRLQQWIGDVGNAEVMRQHAELFARADFIFIDGPKDGVFEQKLLDQFSSMNLPQHPLLLLDDIRVWNMLAIWRRIRRPKLDLTSFGHWSGTGLVSWV
ncbi:MAG TPA: methyltransferase [Terriglobia bacterium]|nr:methyltransferase [Terriglobia bacterium]